MKIRPLHDRILAQRLAAEVGSGKFLESGVTQALTVKPGDLVLILESQGDTR